MKQLRIPYGNRFSLFVPLVLTNGASVEASALQNVQVVLQRSNHADTCAVTVTDSGHYLVITPVNILLLGSYDLKITATLESREIAIPINNAFSICEWTNGATYEDFVVGERVTIEPQVLIGAYYSDEELEQLKRELRQAIASAEAAEAAAQAAKEEAEQVAYDNTAIIGNQQTTIGEQQQTISGYSDTISSQQTTISNQQASITALATASVPVMRDVEAAVEYVKDDIDELLND